MNSNKFYCHNITLVASSASSMNANISGITTSQDLAPCNSNHVASGLNCKESLSRRNHTSGKFSHSSKRVNNCGAAYSNENTNNDAFSASSAKHAASNINNGSHCYNSYGSYINVMSAPPGTMQYHRNKLIPQEYQSRLYHNAVDYRLRNEFYSDNSVTAINGEESSSEIAQINPPSPSRSMQLQGQMQQQNNHQLQQQLHSHHHHHQISTQASQHHYHHYNQQLPSHSAGSIQLQHNNSCSPTATADPVGDTISCNLALGNGQIATATQTNQNNNLDFAVAPTSLTISSLQSQMPPVLYTVHRVVTTAQIQTAGGNTFTSSSSVSSVVSAVRNEIDSMTNVATPVSTRSNEACFVADISRCHANIVAEGNFSNMSAEHNLTGNITNANNYLTIESKEAGAIDATRTANAHTGSTPQMPNNTYKSNVKTISSISRPLQNVIPACVYLMSRVAVHMEIEGTAQCPSQVMLAAALGCEELGIANKLLAQSIFGLWMTSSLLEIQLKSYHRPYAVRVAWHNLLQKFSNRNLIEKKHDEPMIMLKRNVFFSKRDEEKIKDHRILELLYEEAKHNVLYGRYIMEPVHLLMLGGIQARIELGPFNPQTHTVSFFRENQSRFLPQHVAKNSSWSWLPVSRKTSAEVRLLEQFKRVPQTATTRKLMRKYLEFCWALPFYGAAFFHGQVEQPVRGLMSLVNHKDVEVLIAVNERGVFIIDPVECTLLLGMRYEDLSWDFAKPSSAADQECQTCIFLQFDAVENGLPISKLMQIFSKQAPMIDALISHFAECMRKRKLNMTTSDQFHDEQNPIQNSGNGVLCNKLSHLTLATFDEEGRCIGQMGSLSISY